MFQVLVTIVTAANVLKIHLKNRKVSKSCMLLRSISIWISSRHATKVRMMPAMGTTTFSDRLRIMLKMLPFQAWGVAPTVAATSETRVLMLSNSPDRLLTIPPTRRPFSHSVILSQMKFKGASLLSALSRRAGRGRD